MLIIFVLVGVAQAQRVASVTPAYRPAQYLPLRIETDAAGVVRITGTAVQAVEWPAAGRGGVVVPLLVYGVADGLTLDVNGRPVRLDIHALGPDDPDPAELTAFWQAIDPRPPAGPATDDDAYALASLWRPGRSDGTRRWTLLAVLAVVAMLAVARHARPRRATLWLVLAGGGLATAAGLAFPADVVRRELRAEGQPGWQWVWFAGAAGATVSEPWTPGLRWVRGTGGRAAVLRCDAAGRPAAIEATVGADGRVVLARAKP